MDGWPPPRHLPSSMLLANYPWRKPGRQSSRRAVSVRAVPVSEGGDWVWPTLHFWPHSQVLVEERRHHSLFCTPVPSSGPRAAREQQHHRVTVTWPVRDKQLKAAVGSGPEDSPNGPLENLPPTDFTSGPAALVRRVLPRHCQHCPVPHLCSVCVCVCTEANQHFRKSSFTSCPSLKRTFLGE